ncbi:MAG TPA: hypothetical protein DCQ50_09685 [Chryseobacterium sp.]|nr:hypothetical protein [Chryseobacterium sp.]
MNNKFYKIFFLLILLAFSTKISAQCDNFVFAAPVITKATCSATSTSGTIKTTITSGQPAKWELLDFATLAVIQSFNSTAMTFTFTGVPAGNYKVRVSADTTCGKVATQDIVVGYFPSFNNNVTVSSFETNSFTGSCGSEMMRINVSWQDTNTNNAIVYPVTVEVTVHLPASAGGGTQVITQTYNNPPAPAGNSVTVDNSGLAQLTFMNIPYFANSTYSYDLKITDGCGVSRPTLFNRPVTTTPSANANFFTYNFCSNLYNMSINAFDFNLAGPVKATITSYNGSTSGAPVGTSVNMTHTLTGNSTQSCCLATSGGVFVGQINNMPPGDYVITITDNCGRSKDFNYNLNPVRTFGEEVYIYADCGVGSVNRLWLRGTGAFQGTAGSNFIDITSAQLTAAPPGSGLALPYDMMSFVSLGYILETAPGFFTVPGNYTIRYTTTCGAARDVNFTIGRYLPNYNLEVTTGCNIFSIKPSFTNITAGANYNPQYSVGGHQFLLQWYNTVTGKWEHPTNGSSTPSNSAIPVDAGNGLPLQNNTASPSFAKSGRYRVVDVYMSRYYPTPSIFCMVVAKEFTVDFNISFNYNVIQCPDGSYTLLASASGGNGNFTFNLYDSTHTTIVQTNSTGVFTNLPTGNYILDITDTCPNALLNQPISVPGTASPLAVEVTGDPCTIGSQVTLSVPKLGGVTYKWYRTATPGTTLSTSNEYTFTANPPTTSTSYSVQITYAADPTNCVNQTLTYVVATCVCYRDANKIDPGIDTKHGVTLLKRAGSTDPDNWPMLRKSGHTVLESNTKGFVVTRMTSDPSQTTAANYIGKIAAPVEGMMVYDTFSKCLRIYVDGAWKCFVNPACPD